MTVHVCQTADCSRRSTAPLSRAEAGSDRHSQHVGPDRHAIENLPRAECLRLIGSVRIGRIFYTQWAMPAVAVVDFALNGDESIVFRIEAGGRLWSAIRRAVVGFEADRIDEVTHSGWSVTVVGRAEEVVNASEVTELRTLGLDPWAPGERGHFIQIRPEIVTGRRIRGSHREP
jgi:nitroimidazol reductase NimA-like FMN-containing flavoprotein (pyridoxamine 5'-phosphate oxidase superfamily)